MTIDPEAITTSVEHEAVVVSDEFDLPLRVRRKRCASPDTFEWVLCLGDEPVARIWRGRSRTNRQAVYDLFHELERKGWTA